MLPLTKLSCCRCEELAFNELPDALDYNHTGLTTPAGQVHLAISKPTCQLASVRLFSFFL